MTPTIGAILSYTYESPLDFRVYVSGSGVHLRTRDGREVLDGLSGSMNANLGHGNAAVAAAMHAQALGLTAVPSIAGDVSDDCVVLAEKLRTLLDLPDIAFLFTS